MPHFLEHNEACTLFTFAYSHKREAGKQSWSLLFLFVEKYDFVNS